MGAQSGQGTSFNLPNYVGELFIVSPSTTPLLSRLGNGVSTSQKKFEWQTVDLGTRDTSGKLEGANAPTASQRTRSNVYNCCEIFQKSIEVSYSKQAATQTVAGLNGVNQVADELDFQVGLALKDMAMDVNYEMINGVYAYPSDNNSARKMGGLIEAISTNEIAASGTLTAYDVNDAMQMIYDESGFEQGQMTLVCNSVQKMWLSKVYINATRLETTRNVGGVAISSIITDFGTLDIIIDNAVPKGTILILNMGQIKPRILSIPGKGYLFVEPLAKTGSSDTYQLYGEIGLEWGNQLAHAKITGLTTTNPTA